MKGYLQVYTGDGKGKTTAAFGLALRAIGAGLKVFVGQFIKGMPYSEFNTLRAFTDQIVLRQYGRDCFITQDPTPEDITAAREGLNEMKQVLKSGNYQLVIMDEANMATYFHLFPVEELIKTISGRDPAVEVVVTGRKADPKLIDIADLVTDMVDVKHYYSDGVEARNGIEI